MTGGEEFATAAGMGGLGAIAGAMSPDYSAAANTYQQQLQQLAQQYQPYERMGKIGYGMTGALGAAQMANPAGVQNRLAASYTNSPYQQSIMNQTAQQMDTNAAETGMLGSTAANAALQNDMAGMQNQFEQQYINRGMNQFDLGENQMNRLGMTLGGQGYNAFNTGQELQAQGDLAQMQAAMMPSQGSSSFSDMLGAGLSIAGDLM